MQQKCSSRRSIDVFRSLGIARRWRGERHRSVRVDRSAQILNEQMRVRSSGDPHVAVPQEPLHAMDVDTAPEQLGREGVAQIVEAHPQLQRLGPQSAAARLEQRVAASIGALHALRAVALLVIRVLFFVPAPAAAMLIACRDARACQSGAKDLLRVRFARTL